METKKSIDILNKLVQINNDRVEGYETAAKETDEGDLIDLFDQLARTSEQCRTELSEEVQNLGGDAIEGTRISGKFFRRWMDVKAALTGKDRKAILNSCEFGEDAAVSTYRDVLDNDAEELTLDQLSMIEDQFELIKSDHDTIRSLRDALVDSH